MRIEDIGVKLESNGIDNAKIAFNNVRIPYTNLLNRYSDIDPITNKFTSTISSKRERFLTAINELIGGRLSIASTALTGSKIDLLIALRFSKNRFGVGPDGKSSSPIFDYQLQKLALIPLLAQTISYHIAFNRIKDIFVDPSVCKEEKIRLCCIIKPLTTYLYVKIANVCRERCGGQGFLTVNRIGTTVGTSSGSMTGDGDNAVLFQKVTKELIDNLRSGKAELPKMKNSSNQLINEKNFENLVILRDFLVFREVFLIKKIQNTLITGLSKGKTVYQVWMSEASNLIQDVARAYGERIIIDACLLSLDHPDALTNKEILYKIYCLNALVIIQRDLAFYLMNNVISNESAESIEEIISKLVEEISVFAIDLVNNFGIPEYLIRAPIAYDYIKYNEGTNLGEFKYTPKI